MLISDMRSLAGLALCLVLLGGCLPPAELAGRSAGARAPVKAIKVSQRDVTVVGPKGYCVDPSSAQDRTSGSFVILASCSALFAGSSGASGAPGVLTALVSAPSDPPQAPSAAQLDRFFRSADGRSALAHDGKMQSVTVLKTVPLGDVLYLNVRDTSKTRPSELSDSSWRAVLAIKDRLVALSVTGHSAAKMSDTQARTTLERFVKAMRAANPDVSAGTTDRS